MEKNTVKTPFHLFRFFLPQRRPLHSHDSHRVNGEGGGQTLLSPETQEYIEAMEEDLEFARLVQQHIFPRALPEFENFDIAAKYIPAGKVGGDYYDVIELDDKHAAIVFFDVAGHGIGAALIMAVARSAFYTCLQQSNSPGKVLATVNEQIVSSTPEGMFVTCFLGIMNLQTRTIHYSNAGHLPPLLYHGSRDSFSELEGGGPPLGIMDEYTFENKAVRIETGDVLVMYTDGLIESVLSVGKKFDTTDLCATIRQHAGVGSRELIERIYRQNERELECSAWHDDICLLAITVHESEFGERVISLLPVGEQRCGLNFYRLTSEMEIDTFCSIFLTELDQNAYADKVIRQMRIVVIELLLNAIYHGKGAGEHGRVKIAYHVDIHRALIGVQDQGEGFDWAGVLQAVGGDGVGINEKKHGLCIVKHFVDHLIFSKSGSCVVAIKYRKKGA